MTAATTKSHYHRDPNPEHCAGQPARLIDYISRRAGKSAFASTAINVALWTGAREASFYGACLICGAHPQSKTDRVLLDGKAVGIWMGHIDDPTRQIAFVCRDCSTDDDVADTNRALTALGIDPNTAMDWWTSQPLGRVRNDQANADAAYEALSNGGDLQVTLPHQQAEILERVLQQVEEEIAEC